MTRRVVAALAATLLAVTGLSGCADHRPPLEDEPGWNCLVDGNGHCGPSTYSGKVRLVSAEETWCGWTDSNDEDYECDDEEGED